MKQLSTAVLCLTLCFSLTGLLSGSTQAQGGLENLSKFQAGLDTETVLWLSVAYSDNPAELEYYLERYPDGEYTGIANRKLDHPDYVSWQPPLKLHDLERLAREENVLFQSRYSKGLMVFYSLVLLFLFLLGGAWFFIPRIRVHRTRRQT